MDNKPTHKRFQDLSGLKFNRLTVENFAFIRKGQKYWNCVCDCGNSATVCAANLKTGNTKSCGCFRIEVGTARVIKDGISSHPLYKTRSAMIGRCYREKDPRYKTYGKRGIRVCDEWLNDPKAFYDWGIKGWRKGLSIDRIDNDGDYCPENCQWIPRNEQSRKTTKTTFNMWKARVSRNLYHTHRWSTSKIAVFFGVNTRQIWRVIRNQNWNITQDEKDAERELIVNNS